MATHAIVVTDRDGVISLWSEGAEIFFGHRAAKAVGQTLDLIVPEVMRERHWAGFRAAMAGSAPKIAGVTLPTIVRRSGGDIVPATGMLSLLRGPNDAIIGAIGVFEIPE